MEWLSLGLTLDFLAQRQRLQGHTPQLIHGQESPLSPNFGIFQRNPATGLPNFPLGGLFQNVPAGLPSLAAMKAAGSPMVNLTCYLYFKLRKYIIKLLFKTG
jgi:hypothetical protein